MSAHNTTDNFWQVWNTFQWPETKPISYRCYYRPDGSVDFYTMDDLPGSYVEVSKEIYLASPGNGRVENGIFKLMPVRRVVERLVPGHTTGTRCDPRDVCVVVSDHQTATYWDLVKHEID